MKNKKYMSLMLFVVILYNIFSGFYQQNAVAAQGKTYVIATDTTFAPFEWQTVDGKLTGIDMEILQEIAKEQGVHFEVRALGFNAAVQALESGQVDGVMAGMSITPARQQTFDFSDAYYTGGISMAVLQKSDISQTVDLQNKSVAVKIGTQGAAYAESLKQTYQLTINTFEDSASMYQDVLSGNSVAAFEDNAVMAYAIKEQGLDLKLVGELANTTDMGFAVQKGKNQELLELFNRGLTVLKTTGKYDDIIQKYTGESIVPKEDTSLFGILKNNGGQLLSGLAQTILLTGVAIVIALFIGVILGLFSVSNKAILRAIYTIYVDIMRGTPLLVFAFFIYFALPQTFGFKYDGAFLPSVLTLSLNAAAYIGELFRGGIQAVSKGQFEASYSLGLPYGLTMKKVILPQALKIMIPPFINQFVMTLKDTSILSAIGLVELTKTGQLIIARTYASSNTWLVVAFMYIVLITVLTKVSKLLEKKWM